MTLFTIASNCTKEIEKKAQSLSVTRPVDQMPIVPTFPALNVKYDGILSFLLLFSFFFCHLLKVFFSLSAQHKDSGSSTDLTISLRDIVKQGMLEKKGAKRRNWTSRWFVLKKGYLYYFKTQKVFS